MRKRQTSRRVSITALLWFLLLSGGFCMAAMSASAQDIVIAEQAMDKWMYHGRVDKLVLSPDSKRLYIAWNGAYIFDTTHLTFKEIPVQVADTGTGVRNPDGSPVRSSSNLALTPDGKKLYVYDYGAPAINVVDTQTLTTTKVIPIAPLQEVTDLVVSSDGKKLLIAGSTFLSGNREETNRRDKILVVDTHADAIEKILDIGKQHVVWFLVAEDRPVIYGIIQKLGGVPVVEGPDLLGIDTKKQEIVSQIYVPTITKDSALKGDRLYNMFSTGGTSTSNSLQVFNLKTAKKEEEITLPRFSFYPSPVVNQRWIYIMRETSILLVDLQKKKGVKEAELYKPSLAQRLKGQARPDYTENMVLSKDGKRLYVTGLLFQSKWIPFPDNPPPPVKLVITVVDAEKMRQGLQ